MSATVGSVLSRAAVDILQRFARLGRGPRTRRWDRVPGARERFDAERDGLISHTNREAAANERDDAPVT